MREFPLFRFTKNFTSKRKAYAEGKYSLVVGDYCDGIGGLSGHLGWAKLMEWKYPSVEVVVTNKKMFRTAGAVGAAASL